MKPVKSVAALMALFISLLSYAQNDTPMEVLVNIAHENTRFVPTKVFSKDNRNASYLDSYLSEYEVLKLNPEVLSSLVNSDKEAILLELPYKSEVLKVKMINHDVRSESFSIIDLQNREELEIPAAQFYRGSLERSQDGLAGFSFFENEAFGIISSKNKGNIILVKDPINPGNDDNYILYSESDLKQSRTAECHADLFEKVDKYTETSVRSNVYSTCDDLEVYLEATYKLYQAKGSYSSTANFISAFFNNAAVIYRNEGIYTSLKTIAINTSEDGYSNLTSSFDNLNRFGEITKNKYQQYGAELAHLVDYNEEGLGGVAWINAMCTNYYYYSGTDWHFGAYAYSSVLTSQANFPDYSLTVFMFAHEMGHNLGSQHTQWCGWSGGPIDNCAPVEKGPCSAGPTPSNGGTIMSYCHNEPEIGINFSNGFGQQPGDLIRSKVVSKTCEEEYIVKGVVPTLPNRKITANRECTTDGGWTHYYYDNQTSDENDDILVLAVLKGNEDIGNLDDGSLMVQMQTSSNAGNGSTHIVDPGYQSNSDWHVMNRWFELQPTNEPTQPVTVRFPYTNEDLTDVMMNQPAVASHADLIFYKINNPGNPDPDDGHASVGNDDIIFYTNGSSATLDKWRYVKNGTSHFAEFKVSSFSGGGGGFTQESQSSLPVELLSYKAERAEKFAKLTWKTAQEINNDFFTIERSVDGINYAPIGKVNGSGSTSEAISYDFTDRNPQSGINYYRLSQTDFDGTHVSLGVRTVQFERINTYNLFPNPVKANVLFLDYETEKEMDVTVLVLNMKGQQVLQNVFRTEKGSNTYKLPVSQLSSGMYLIQIIDERKTYTRKLIKD